MTRIGRAISVALVLAHAALPTRVARAQTGGDKASAEALFNEGKALLANGNLAEACPKLAESLRLDSGVGTMLYLAECWERSGKTASAWAQFREAQSVAASAKDAREKVARARADKLEPKLSRLAIVVPKESETDGLSITRDGAEVGRALWGTEVPVDPGKHVVLASAPDKVAFEATVDLAEGGAREQVRIPLLAAAPRAEPKEAMLPAGRDKSAGGARGGRGLSTQRIAALGLGGLGVVGVGVGAFFGLHAMSSIDQANAHCDDRFCNAAGLSLRDDAKSEATVSTIAFAAGGLAIAGGVALWFTAPKSDATSTPRAPGIWGLSVVPALDARSASLAASGRF